jgi:hypothetical protein
MVLKCPSGSFVLGLATFAMAAMPVSLPGSASLASRKLECLERGYYALVYTKPIWGDFTYRL